MRGVIIVPRRAGVPSRDRAWEYTRKWWEKLHYPIYVVEHPGPEPFNRAWALNQGATEAWPWDVALFLDADVVENSPEQVHQAFQRAYATGRITVAHTAGKDLTKQGTEKVYRGETFDWNEHLAEVRRVCDSRANAVRADLFEKVGGFDTRFRGWGHEDVAFFNTCEVARGRAIRIPGASWHLWHPHMLAKSKDTDEWKAGERLNYRYTYSAQIGWVRVRRILRERKPSEQWTPP